MTIAIENLFLKQETTHITKTATIKTHSSHASSGADSATINYGPNSVTLSDFAQKHYSFDENALIPQCTVVRWNELLVIEGLMHIATISSGSGINHTKLFRKINEDNGFYSFSWLLIKKKLIGIYESGVIAVNENGAVAWHIPKSWDDTLISKSEEKLTLLREDGSTVEIQLNDGST